MAILHLAKGAAATRGVWLMALVGVAYAQPIRPVVFVGNSMAPTYANQKVAVTAPVGESVRRGDVVVAEGPDGTFIKRVALVPGDPIMQVHMLDRWVYAFGMDAGLRHRSKRVRYVPLPEGMVFLLGDNVGASTDSRDFGPVPISSLRRRVVFPVRPAPPTALRLAKAGEKGST